MPKEVLAKSAMVSLAGSGFAAVSALLLTVLIGRGLGAAGTGIFFQAVGLFTIAAQVLRLGTNSGIVRTISAQRAFGRRGEATRVLLIAAVPVLALSLAAILLMVAHADQLAGWLGSPGGEQELATIIRQVSPFVLAAALLGTLQAMIRMLNGVVSFTLLQNVFLPLSRLILVAAALVLGWDALGVVWAWALSLPLWVIIALALLIRPLLADARRRSGEVEKRAVRTFWAFSSTRGIGGALEVALDWSDVLIVAALRSPAEAGVYAVVTRAVRAGQIVDRAMRVAVSPSISHHLALEELEDVCVLHTKVSRAMILCSWPFYLTLIIFGPAVLALFGPEFTAGAAVLSLVSIAMMLATTAGMLQSIILMGGRSSWQVWIKTTSLVLSVGLNLLLVPLLGITGAAIAWMTVIAVDTSVSGFLVHRRMGVRIEPRRLLSAAVPPLLVFGIAPGVVRAVFGATLPTLSLAVAFAMVIYLLVLWRWRNALGVHELFVLLTRSKKVGRLTKLPAR